MTFHYNSRSDFNAGSLVGSGVAATRTQEAGGCKARRRSVARCVFFVFFEMGARSGLREGAD